MHKIINFTRGGALCHHSGGVGSTEHSPLPFPLQPYSTKQFSSSLSLLPSNDQDHDPKPSYMYIESATQPWLNLSLRLGNQRVQPITPPTSCNIVAMYTTFDPLISHQTSGNPNEC